MSAPMRIASIPKPADSFTTYRYLRDLDEKSWHQIAFKFYIDNINEKIHFSFAMCSPNDNFDFAKARELLDDRMADEKSIFYLKAHYDRGSTLVQNAIDTIEARLGWVGLEMLRLKNARKRTKTEKKSLARLEEEHAAYRLFLDTVALMAAKREVDLFMHNGYFNSMRWFFTIVGLKFGWIKPLLRVEYL